MSGWQSRPPGVEVGADEEDCVCKLEIWLEVLEEVTVLKVGPVSMLEDEELDSCVEEISVEDGTILVLLIVDNAVVELERLVEEKVLVLLED